MVTVNYWLLVHQLRDVLNIWCEQMGVKLIDFKAQIGRSRVCWVHIEDKYGNRRATLISREELNDAFTQWRRRNPTRRLRYRADYTISYALIATTEIGQHVWNPIQRKVGVIVKKGFIWAEALMTIDWGDYRTIESPMCLDI